MHNIPFSKFTPITPIQRQNLETLEFVLLGKTSMA